MEKMNDKKHDSPMPTPKKAKRLKPTLVAVDANVQPSMSSTTPLSPQSARSVRSARSNLSEVEAEGYSRSYYDAALAALDSQRHNNSYQSHDAAIIYQHLRLAIPSDSSDVAFVTDAQMRDMCAEGHALPTRAVVSDRGIPPTAPKSVEEMANRALDVFGGSDWSWIPQRKSGHMQTDEFHRRVTTEDFASHWLQRERSSEIWNLLEASVRLFPNADTWIPDYATHDNLLYDFLARTTDTKRTRAADFTDKTSWFLTADAGAYSPLHFDSHGFGTFLHLLAGECLLMFCNHVEDEAERDIIFKHIRATDPLDAQTEAVFRKHLRYVVLQAGQMWFMEPGVLHSVYRCESTLIFGGHYIPKKRLGKWVYTMKEHLRRYNSTNEDPDDVLLYLQNALELITNANKHNKLGGWGDAVEMSRFLVGAKELLEHSDIWLKEDGAKQAMGKKGMKTWKQKVEEILKEHRVLLESASSPVE